VYCSRRTPSPYALYLFFRVGLSMIPGCPSTARGLSCFSRQPRRIKPRPSPARSSVERQFDFSKRHAPLVSVAILVHRLSEAPTKRKEGIRLAVPGLTGWPPVPSHPLHHLGLAFVNRLTCPNMTTQYSGQSPITIAMLLAHRCARDLAVGRCRNRNSVPQLRRSVSAVIVASSRESMLARVGRWRQGNLGTNPLLVS
jgi:hypothetical protein